MQPSHSIRPCASRYSRRFAVSYFTRHAVFFCFLSLVASGDVKSTDVALQTLSAQGTVVRRPRYVDRTMGGTPIIMMVTADASAVATSDFQIRIPSLLAFYSTVRWKRGATATSHMYGRGPQRCSWRVTRTIPIFSASSKDMIPSSPKTVDSRDIREGGDRSRRAGETRMDTEDPLKLKLPGGEVELHRIVNGLAQRASDDESGDDPTDALRAMDRLAEVGFSTFLLGNAIGGGRELAEERAGAYLKSASSGKNEATFLTTLSLRAGLPVTRRAVTQALEHCYRRMGVERLDLVQLCWRDFEDRYFLDALNYLQEAQEVQNVGVCGFGAAPLALARKNGLSIVSNLVPSSMIGGPPGGAGTLRECREQGIAVLSTRGSMGGIASQDWLYRSLPRSDNMKDMPIHLREAFAGVLGWGGMDGDGWHLFQSKVMPVLEAVARKYGHGHTMADVATAFHLCRRSFSSFSSFSTRSTNPGGFRGSPDSHADTSGGERTGEVMLNYASAISIPVRVRSGGISAKQAANEDAHILGRRGAELAPRLEQEDLELLSEAVGEGAVMRDISSSKFSWEEDEAERLEDQEDKDRGDDGILRGRTIFLF